MKSDDLISRQAAIDAMCELVHHWFGGDIKDEVREINRELGKLPPAQPDLDEWCTDCKEYDQERHCCPRWSRVIRNTLKDAQQEITDIDVQEYCRRRNLVVISYELFHEMQSNFFTVPACQPLPRNRTKGEKNVN